MSAYDEVELWLYFPRADSEVVELIAERGGVKFVQPLRRDSSEAACERARDMAVAGVLRMTEGLQ